MKILNNAKFKPDLHKKEAQKKCLESFGEKLGFKSLEDWYQLSKKNFKTKEEKEIISELNGSRSKMLLAVFPEWKVEYFKKKNFWHNVENQKKFLSFLGEKLEFKSMEDWYKLKSADFHLHGGSKLLKMYNWSPKKVLLALYPTHDWKVEKLHGTPKIFWQNHENQKKFLENLGVKLGLKSMEDWYLVTSKDFVKNRGSELLKIYKNSPKKAILGVFPDYKWDLDKFSKKYRNFWLVRENQKNYLNSLGEKLGFESMDDWYTVTGKDFSLNGGYALLRIYGGSTKKIVLALFPNHPWEIQNFSRKPKYFWQNIENCKKFVVSLAKKLEIKSMEDWYKITYEDFRLHKGRELLNLFYNSPAKILAKVFPDHPWELEKFEGIRKQNYFWRIVENHKNYLTSLGQKLGFKTMEDWYKVTPKIFRENGGMELIRFYNGSICQMLLELYPNHKWDFEKMSKKQTNFWENIENQKKYLKLLGEKLGFTTREDWYKLTHKNLGLGAGGLLAKYDHSVTKLITTLMPEKPWFLWLFNEQKFTWSNQDGYLDWLKKVVENWAEILKIRDLKMWYNVDVRREISEKNLKYGVEIMRNHKTLFSVLSLVFPQENWKERKFGMLKYETLLGKYIEELFPNSGVLLYSRLSA